MTRTDLPREVRRRPLDYNRLVSTLDMIDGEHIIVRIASREADNESTAGVASIIGELKHQIPARYEGDEFSIGSPYPDCYPAHVRGGILFIREETFESATLTTFDVWMIAIGPACVGDRSDQKEAAPRSSVPPIGESEVPCETAMDACIEVVVVLRFGVSSVTDGMSRASAISRSSTVELYGKRYVTSAPASALRICCRTSGRPRSFSLSDARPPSPSETSRRRLRAGSSFGH